MGMQNRVSALTLIMFMAACSSGKFSGKADATTAAAGASEQKTNGTADSDSKSGGTDAAPQGPVAGCDQSAVGVTQVKLLSSGISTKLTTQTLRYELAVLNCKDGTVQSLKNQPVFFDLDASLATGFQSVPYSILDAKGTSISSSTLQVVTGSDLFGNTGNYAHWTTQNFSYSSELDKLILEIKLENTQVLPRDPAEAQIISFLRIGSAQAVTQPLMITE